MKPVWFSLTPMSPVYIGQVKPGFNFLFTQDIIPGSVIRGAVAEYFLYTGETHKISDFLKGIKFGYFRPSRSGLQLSLPFPLSSLTCKKYEGFRSQKGHGVEDFLIPYLAYTELRHLGAEFPMPFLPKCKECGSRMEKITGFYVKERNYRKISIPKCSQTKVAINRKRRSSEEGMLYSITAIEPGIVFTGKLFFSDSDDAKPLIKAIEKMRIGGLTTRGYGEVSVQIQEDLLQPLRDMERRIEEFNSKLKERWKDLLSVNISNSHLPEEPKEVYFSVTLISPAILKDEANLPTLKLTLNLNGDSYNPMIYFAQSEFIGGWSTAWGLPKETELAVKEGGVYVYKAKKEEYEKIIQGLKKLELEGIGERTEEGFGEVLICDPFHKEGQDVNL